MLLRYVQRPIVLRPICDAGNFGGVDALREHKLSFQCPTVGLVSLIRSAIHKTAVATSRLRLPGQREVRSGSLYRARRSEWLRPPHRTWRRYFGFG